MDHKAKKILMQTFWSSNGWKSSPAPFAGEEFEYAKSQGVMFDPLTIQHDELIQRLYELHQRIPKKRIAAAFLQSLSTRKVHIRSALSSWALTNGMQLHTYGQLSITSPCYSRCGDCEHHKLQSDRDYVQSELNVLNFERMKWGGVRLNELLYCWLDLELFSREEDAIVDVQDVVILQNMLQAVEACAEQDGPRKLEKRWKDLLPSSKHERDVIMEIWGYAGILAAKDTPRTRRGGNDDFNSMALWQGSDGYSREAVEFYFGDFL